MPGEIVYVADEATAQFTPDALRIALAQSGLPGRMSDEGNALLLRNDKLALRLLVEDGWVTEIAVDVTFVDENAVADRLCDWLETMGWTPLDEVE